MIAEITHFSHTIKNLVLYSFFSLLTTSLLLLWLWIYFRLYSDITLYAHENFLIIICFSLTHTICIYISVLVMRMCDCMSTCEKGPCYIIITINHYSFSFMYLLESIHSGKNVYVIIIIIAFYTIIFFRLFFTRFFWKRLGVTHISAWNEFHRLAIARLYAAL